MGADELMQKPFQYFGGKGNFLARLLPLVPEGGRPYCEPFAGSAALFFARRPAPCEVLNDIDRDIVNVFRVLQDRRHFIRFQQRARYTLYSRDEYARAIRILRSDTDHAVLRAWAFFVVANQSMSAVVHDATPGTWGRTFVSKGGMADTTNKWVMRLSMLEDWHRRLLHAQIDCCDGVEAIRYWDNRDAVFYVDPPYALSTRADDRGYRNNMTDEQLAGLVKALLDCDGAVVMSCYDAELFRPLLAAGWERRAFQTACHAAGRVRGSGLRGRGAAMAKVPRTEVVYSNQRAIELRSGAQRLLFGDSSEE